MSDKGKGESLDEHRQRDSAHNEESRREREGRECKQWREGQRGVRDNAKGRESSVKRWREGCCTMERAVGAVGGGGTNRVTKQAPGTLSMVSHSNSDVSRCGGLRENLTVRNASSLLLSSTALLSSRPRTTYSLGTVRRE